MVLSAKGRKGITTVEAVTGILILHPKLLADDAPFEMGRDGSRLSIGRIQRLSFSMQRATTLHTGVEVGLCVKHGCSELGAVYR